jgi:protein tyrosine phosphatase type 4A
MGRFRVTVSEPLIPIRVPGDCTEVEYKGLRCVITELPSSVGLTKYLEDLKLHGVSVLVQVCEVKYSSERLVRHGISVVNLDFEDGNGPPRSVLDAWFELLRNKIAINPESAVAIHCVSGLGRAPVLVALAFIELGMKCKDAVELIRAKRYGAINEKQLSYLERYKIKGDLTKKPEGVLKKLRRKSSIFLP